MMKAQFVDRAGGWAGRACRSPSPSCRDFCPWPVLGRTPPQGRHARRRSIRRARGGDAREAGIAPRLAHAASLPPGRKVAAAERRTVNIRPVERCGSQIPCPDGVPLDPPRATTYRVPRILGGGTRPAPGVRFHDPRRPRGLLLLAGRPLRRTVPTEARASVREGCPRAQPGAVVRSDASEAPESRAAGARSAPRPPHGLTTDPAIGVARCRPSRIGRGRPRAGGPCCLRHEARGSFSGC